MKKFFHISVIVLLTMVPPGLPVLFLQTRWVAPKEADFLKNPLRGSAASAERGKAKFKVLCLVCHGERGKGDGIGSATLKPKPANLVSSLVQSQSDGAIFWKISTGRPPMASYKEILKESERWDMVNYIRKLK